MSKVSWKKVDQNLVYEAPEVERFLFLRVPFLVIKLVLYITYFEEALACALVGT